MFCPAATLILILQPLPHLRIRAIVDKNHRTDLRAHHTNCTGKLYMVREIAYENCANASDFHIDVRTLEIQLRITVSEYAS
jgi:hypothetical protein